MPILYKNTDRLLRDVKKVRKIITSELGCELSAQDAMDLVAGCFGWPTWNAMHVASQKKSEKHTWWHDMRWRDKIVFLNLQIPAVSKLSNQECDWAKKLNIKDMNLVSTPLSDLLKPDENPLHVSREPRGIIDKLTNFKKPKSPYSDFSLSRKREGIYINSSDTYLVADHLKAHLLPSFDEPDCIVFCDPATAIDFARAFDVRGYHTVLINSLGGGKLPYELNVEEVPLLPDVFAAEGSPFDLKNYLDHCLDYMTDVNYDSFFEPSTRNIINLVARLSRKSRNGVADTNFLTLPSLRDIVLWSQKGAGDPIADDCALVIKRLFGERDNSTYLAKIADGEGCPTFEERYQYACMSISMAINILREKMFGSLNSTTVSNFEHRVEKTLYLFPVENYASHKQHLNAMLNMLLERLAMLPQTIEPDMCFILDEKLTCDHEFMAESSAFNFTRFNSARVNGIVFGERESSLANYDTHVSLENGDFKVSDCRVR